MNLKCAPVGGEPRRSYQLLMSNLNCPHSSQSECGHQPDLSGSQWYRLPAASSQNTPGAPPLGRPHRLLPVQIHLHLRHKFADIQYNSQDIFHSGFQHNVRYAKLMEHQCLIKTYISGLSDETILVSTLALSSLLTVVNVSTELFVKLSNDSLHLPPIPFFLFLGAEGEEMNTTQPWFFVSSLISIGLCVVAILVYKVIKNRYSSGPL